MEKWLTIPKILWHQLTLMGFSAQIVDGEPHGSLTSYELQSELLLLLEEALLCSLV